MRIFAFILHTLIIDFNFSQSTSIINFHRRTDILESLISFGLFKSPEDKCSRDMTSVREVSVYDFIPLGVVAQRTIINSGA
jgi:hypothetical protein